MKRRNFLACAAIGGTIASATSLARPAIAQGRRELIMVTTWSRDMPGLGVSARRLAETITRMTDGRLTVKLYGAGELVPAFDSFEAVSSGKADLYHGAEYYWDRAHPAFSFFTSVPFGMTANELSAWILWGGGQDLWDELSGRFAIKALPCGNTGVQMGGWFNKEIKRLDDLRGVRIRMPGMGGRVMQRLGAEIVALPGGEIQAALKSGRIDAAEWIGPWNDLAIGLADIAAYYYYPGFQEPGTMTSCGFNLAVWNSLSPTEQTIVRTACHAEIGISLAEFNAKNGAALGTMLNARRIELRRFSDDILNAMGEESGRVVAEAGEHDDLAQRIYRSFIASRRNSIAWSRLADESFLSARRMPFAYYRG